MNAWSPSAHAVGLVIFTLWAALSASAVVWNVGEGDEGSARWWAVSFLGSSVAAACFFWELP